MMKVGVEGDNVTEVITKLKAITYVLEQGNKSGVTVEEIKSKRGSKAKNEKAAEELEEEETEEEENDFEEEETEEEEEEETDTLSESEIEKLKGALKAYSAKNGKDKAVKMLHKYAKKSTDVKKSDLPKLLKSLKT